MLGLEEERVPPMLVAELPKGSSAVDIAITATVEWRDLDIWQDRHTQLSDPDINMTTAAFGVKAYLEGEKLAAAANSCYLMPPVL